MRRKLTNVQENRTHCRFGPGAVSVGGAYAAGGEGHVEDIDFAHEGPFGRFDQFQLQRGLQVYTEVCSACHGLKFVPIRTLADEGGPMLAGRSGPRLCGPVYGD